ncbi:MAG TPA: nucleoside recognition domain-containing protein [Paludibacteraceae bacterium]|nr:nucleoside recognition domain-containing protein [Paludibacteraceae bacterium]HPS11054.1 nucleoside recognition domain-containing protein [Paludibacteraceae bacterium]
MALNYIWIAFIVIAFFVALLQMIFFGNISIFNEVLQSIFGSAKSGFEISLGLTGILTFWMGILKVAEHGGALKVVSRMVAPFFTRIYPEIPKDHPALSSIFLNMSANMLGLDNAATPMGLQAMKEMQELNPKKDTASNPMIMFLVLNTAGIVLVPMTVMMYRTQLGAVNPADVFLPIIVATLCAFITGLITVSVIQKINLFNRVVMGVLAGLVGFVIGLVYFFSTLSQEQITAYSSFSAAFIILSIIVIFVLMAVKKKVNVYNSFIEGAKEGFQVAVGIIPYLVAMLVAIGMFRASGTLDLLIDGIRYLVALTGVNTDFVEALPTAFMKPLSGSGARGMMIETMTRYGADSFVGRLSCIIQGSTDTTFYILAVYFGSVKVTNTRYAVMAGLFADFVGITAAILLGYLFFH